MQSQIDQNLDIVNLILLSKLESSKSEIRRIIRNKGVKINNSTIEDEKLLILNNFFEKNKTLKLSLGKKRHIKVELV
jgi:tyrosyl-tRNA synthetase